MDKIVENALVNALRFGVFTRVHTLDVPYTERRHHNEAKNREGLSAWFRPRSRR